MLFFFFFRGTQEDQAGNKCCTNWDLPLHNDACGMLKAFIVGLQRKLLSSLKFSLSEEALAGPKVQKLLNLVDQPSTLAHPLLGDEDLFFWAQIALDGSAQDWMGQPRNRLAWTCFPCS